MSIRRKLYLNFGLVLLVVVFLCLINIAAVQREHSARNATQHAFDFSQEVEGIRFQMMQNRQQLSNYLLSGSNNEVNSLTDGLAKLREAISKAGQQAQTDQQKNSLSKLSDSERDWENNFARPLIEKRKQVDSGNATVGELQIQYLQLDPVVWTSKSTTHVDELERFIDQDLSDQRKEDATASTVTMLVAILGAALALGVGSFIAYRTTNAILNPLDRLIGVAREIGETGDLEHQIDIRQNDEIGVLAKTFSTMVGYLREMSQVSEAIARGDLTVQVRPRSQRDTLAIAFTRMIEGLRSLVSAVRDSASQVSSGSNQVASASEESAKLSVQASSSIDEVTSTMHEMSVNVQNMVKSTQMQSSSVSETSSSIDEMVASIQRVADTAKVLLDISQRSREEVQAGISTMQKTTDGLGRINTSIQSSSEIIDVLGTRADDIGKIIEVIDDLAEQTNLLALNAAIEAARAGEHGLGFAVVAEEVRKLAEKSAASTKEISELIQSIQKEARRAVENMQKSTTIVDEGLTLGTDLNGALKKISNVVTEVYKFAQEIGAATNEQSHGSSQIAKATTRLNELTHEINSAVEEQASGAQAVVMAMERMRELIQRFTSGSTELAASAEQMSKMSRVLIDSMDRFSIDANSSRVPAAPPAYGRGDNGNGYGKSNGYSYGNGSGNGNGNGNGSFENAYGVARV
ncbi:MAG TPA: methyl-accepting chemotaxis protein [Terriglobales bacterium]|nr:methyl-accepting chemotaxis protein [Terriglobales bacterium]